MPQSNSGTLNWNPVPGAVSYDVVVVADGADLNVTPAGLQLSALNVLAPENTAPNADVFAGLISGFYHLQVRAVAADPVSNSAWSGPDRIDWDAALPTPTNIHFT